MRSVMRSVLFFLLVFFAFGATAAFAQHGGKAEPLRIKFAAGRSSSTLTGSLSNAEEMEYVFSATKGQKVTIKNTRSSLFDFRVFSEENFPEGDFDSSPIYTFVIPATGDYNFSVRKKQVRTPRRARFTVTLTIK